jgi:2-C-methyl-D-erythritol 4-phosphate cytidylyltransferase/2-C-methyl-D-erythritol 2,4-cyclodiphosphate synthase
MGAVLNKAFLPLGDRPLLLHSISAFEAAAAVDAYVVVASPDEVDFCRVLLAPYQLKKLVAVVSGGTVRQESAAAGVRALPEDCGLVAVHDAARPLLSTGLLEGAVKRATDNGTCANGQAALVVAVPVKDTIKMVDSSGVVKDTPNRDGLWIAQTPQIFRRNLLLQAYAEAERDGWTGTDDASLVERLGIPVVIYQGSYDNLKVTTPEDLQIAQALLKQRSVMEPAARVPSSAGLSGTLPGRVGIGYDVHPFDPGRSLVLGGVVIPGSPGLAGHSDADVALHALMDACLGAAGLRDIGHHFPPGDPRWQDAPSLALLAGVRSILAAAGYTVCQVDLIIAAEKPRLASHLEDMQQRIGAVLGIPADNAGIKATTTEGLGFVGRREGIAAWAVATITSTK